MVRNRLAYWVAVAWFSVTAPSLCLGADCPELVSAFQRAVANHALEAAREAEDHIGSEAPCQAEDAGIRAQLQDFELRLVADPSTSQHVRQDALADVEANAGSWREAAALGDQLFAQHNLSDAAAVYDRAIGLAGQTSALTEAERNALLAKAGAVKMLLSNDDEGHRQIAFPAATRGPHGALGGIYSPVMRGLTRVTVPLPINFESGTAIFTPVGEQAARELAEALIQQKPAEATLIGHTDPRGSDSTNLQLSEQRARRVADFVRQELATAHVVVNIHIIGKGKSEPFDVSTLPYRPSDAELWALDRRVEFVR